MHCIVDTNGTRLRVRAGPGGRYQIIGSLADGERVRVLSYHGPWGHLSRRGWVDTSFLVDASTTLRQNIAHLLCGRACQGIGFQLNGNRLDSEAYRRVAQYLLDTSWPHPVRITTNPACLPIARTTGKRVAGMYGIRSNTLFLRGADVLSTDDDRATVVHECSHIVYDMLRVPCVGMDIEAAAYLAQNWYLINLRGPHPEAANEEVLPIVRDVMGRAEGHGSHPPHVTREERHALHRILVGYGYRWRDTARYARPDGLSPAQ